MHSKAHVNGHPLHPAMVAAPIGMLLGAFVLNVAVMVDGLSWLPSAALLTWVGTGLLALAAIPGFVDYATVVPREGATRRLANKHMVLGIFIALIFLASSWIHYDAWLGSATARAVDAAFWINLAGAILLGIQGWLGGELVFKGRVAVIEEAEARGRTKEARAAERRHPARV